MFTKWNHKMVLLIVAILTVSTLSISAQDSYWTANNESRANIVTDKAVARASYPTEYRLFNLNIEPLKRDLFSIVDSGNGMARLRSTVITLPNAYGSLEQFEVFEASNFDAELQARFPEIRAFSGQGITDPHATLKLSISPKGIQTMVFRTDTDNEFIEAYSADSRIYSVFSSNRAKGGLPWACATDDKEYVSDLSFKLPAFDRAPESNTGEIKTMRLAQSNNGEYANFFGATSSAQVALVLAAFNATLTRANGVYEKDLAIHLNLIAATTNVIYYDPATDPYTSLGSWNGQLQSTLTANIGEANYDIGHMFGASGGGGNAGCIGCVCVDGTKGRGITSPADAIPMGDNFDIDYVVHEVGHQMGANHTFSMSNESTGVNKEVGSGITIMGYAGITSQDVAPHSIDVFHHASIDQIQTNMAGKTCPVTTVMTANHAPVVAALSNYTIPITTPFALTGSATDAENDPLTYNWEQNDNSTTTGNASVASPTKLTGPNFLTFPSTTSPTRVFPRLSTIQAGLAVTPVLPGGDAVANIEALSSVSRVLNFRLTVRDNRPYVPASTIGQTNFKDMTVTVTNTAGPFKVTAPNTGVTWAGNSNQTVTWDVANTNIGLVNVANVSIWYSSDSGQTWTVVLASTPNDGSQSILVPSVASSTARIKVQAVGNIFFDMSDANFTTTNAPVRSRADFDGDGRSDLSVFRPSSGVWYQNRSTAGFAATNWGLSADIVAPGDFDGDGKTDLSIYRPDASGSFYVLNSSNASVTYQVIGNATDKPVVADYDGDGKSDLALFRPTNNTWYVIKSTGGQTQTVYGQSGDTPVAGDFDGDGSADITVFRNGTWYTLRSSSPVTPTATAWGSTGDLLVPADYDGDGKDDLAVFRPSNGAWYVLQSSGGMAINVFGTSGDVPVPGDYDGDGKDDIAVYRNGTWYINRTTSGLQISNFGLSADKPIPAGYLP